MRLLDEEPGVLEVRTSERGLGLVALAVGGGVFTLVLYQSGPPWEWGLGAWVSGGFFGVLGVLGLLYLARGPQVWRFESRSNQAQVPTRHGWGTVTRPLSHFSAVELRGPGRRGRGPVRLILATEAGRWLLIEMGTSSDLEVFRLVGSRLAEFLGVPYHDELAES